MKPRTLLGMTLAAALVAIIGLGAWYADNRPEPPATSDTPIAGFPSAAKTGIALDRSTPYTISVLGDSTGNEQSEWVYLMAETIATRYSRQVTIHNWSLPETAYGQTEIIGKNSGDAPVVIWNGSASGTDAGYSTVNFETMSPERPDLVIINHGHNHTTPKAAVQGVDNLVAQCLTTWAGSPPALAIILQNPRMAPNNKTQEEKVAALRQAFVGRPEVELVDVWAAFESAGDLRALTREDGNHPDEAGQILWARTVEDALGIH